MPNKRARSGLRAALRHGRGFFVQGNPAFMSLCKFLSDEGASGLPNYLLVPFRDLVDWLGTSPCVPALSSLSLFQPTTGRKATTARPTPAARACSSPAAVPGLYSIE